MTIKDINLVVWADIPNPTTEPLLHDVVTHNILYSPYGTYNTFMPYMHNKKYIFQFPYTF